MATTEEELTAAHDALSNEAGYQFELPVEQMVQQERQRADSEGVLFDAFRALGNMISALGPLLQIALIAFVVLLLVYIAWSIYKGVQSRQARLRDRSGNDSDAELLQTVDLRPDAVVAENLLTAADRLADEGDYARALRGLLHHSIAELQSRIRQRIGISFTAREIGRLGDMPDSSRKGFQALIGMVEVSAFGLSPVSREDYFEARRNYEIFAFGEARK